jgi:hypothetical protein
MEQAVCKLVAAIHAIPEPRTIIISEFSNHRKNLTSHFNLPFFCHQSFTLCHQIFSAGTLSA